MRPKNIELHIEELVLHGFAQDDCYRIADSIERELVRLFAEQGMPKSLTQAREIAHLDSGEFEADRGSRPEVNGAKVAQAVYGGLNR